MTPDLSEPGTPAAGCSRVWFVMRRVDQVLGININYRPVCWRAEAEHKSPSAWADRVLHTAGVSEGNTSRLIYGRERRDSERQDTRNPLTASDCCSCGTALHWDHDTIKTQSFRPWGGASF